MDVLVVVEQQKNVKRIYMSSLEKILGGAKKSLMSPSNNLIIHSKIILYALFIVSIINLFSFLIERDVVSVLIFALTGFIVQFFSKNMIIVLFMCLFVANIIKHGIDLKTESFSALKLEPMAPDAMEEDEEKELEDL